MRKKFADNILDYHFSLSRPFSLHNGIEWLLPYEDGETRRCMQAFYNLFYNDRQTRTIILGINPGRFGAGLTGVPFTDPIRLEKLGITNAFPKKQELSSVFIYEMIDRLGGPERFYKQFYITSLSPLGFVRDGKNYNYYDDAELLRMLRPWIIQHLEKQIAFGINTEVVYCLGQGKNYDFLQRLNDEHQWWRRVVPLPHPRWVMQYRLKSKQFYIQEYRIQLSPCFQE